MSAPYFPSRGEWESASAPEQIDKIEATEEQFRKIPPHELKKIPGDGCKFPGIVIYSLKQAAAQIRRFSGRA